MRRALIYLHISIFLWGFTGIFGRAIELKELVLVWYRLIFTVIILLLIPAFSRNIKKLSLKESKRIIFVGFLVAIHWVLFYGSIKYSNISIGLSCLSTIAVFTSLIDPIVNRKKINVRELLLAIFALIGMLVIFRVQEIQRTGIILGIGAALVGSYFTILNAKLVKDFPSETVTFYELASGLFLITILLPFYQHIFPSSSIIPTRNDLILLLFFSIFCTVIPFNLSLKALQHISAFTSNLYINLEPIYGIIFAFIFFHEQKELQPGFYIGSGIILSSVIIYTVAKYRKQLISAATQTKNYVTGKDAE
ncbi:permease [Bacteroidota bacterium]|nr:permease [Bacteroidota bacterium]